MAHLADQAAEIRLPDRATIALGALRETAREGSLALSVGVGLAVGRRDPRGGGHAAGGTPRRARSGPARLPARAGAAPADPGERRVEVERLRARTKAGEEVESRRRFVSRDLLTEAASDRIGPGSRPTATVPVWSRWGRWRRGPQPLRGLSPPRGRHRREASRADGSGPQRVGPAGDPHRRDRARGAHGGGGVGRGRRWSQAPAWARGEQHREPEVCQALLDNLAQRGRDPERPLLAVIDGGRATRPALKAT